MNILFFLTPKSEVAYIEDTYSLRQILEKMEVHKYSSMRQRPYIWMRYQRSSNMLPYPSIPIWRIL